jgi:hypothetical protein
MNDLRPWANLSEYRAVEQAVNIMRLHRLAERAAIVAERAAKEAESPVDCRFGCKVACSFHAPTSTTNN